ncbi:MAG TPA: hypothetical protein VNQ76_13740 [Planctomicrobium sp.]|nr:hypothetical protein [Planctomicrobium sp.]
MKSVILRNFRFCLLFCFGFTAVSVGLAQEFETTDPEGSGFRRSFGRGDMGRGGGRDFRRSFNSAENNDDGGGYGPSGDRFGGRGFRPVSDDELESVMGEEEAYQIRRGFPDGFRRGPDSFREGSYGGPGMDSPASNLPATARRTTSATKTRVTQTIPETYLTGDLDGDGQISFFEWRQWKRGDLAGFNALDHNQDGFLTPAELRKGPSGTSVVSSPIAVSTSSGPAGETTDSRSSGRRGEFSRTSTVSAPSTPSGSPSSPSSDADVLKKRAENMFRHLDKNRDGSVSTEEWGASTRLKPRFEAAGIDLTAPMPQEAFVDHFVKLPPE